jgi:FkbM family methyltransferase
MAAGSPVERVINGDAIYLAPEFASAEALGDEWEPRLYAAFKQALRPGMTVLDVGASFGLYSLAAARVVGPAGRVYAFEPAVRSAAALRRHLDWNAAGDRVEVVEAAVGDTDGEVTFWDQDTSFVASLLHAMARQEEDSYAASIRRRRVPSVSLDAFCRDRAVDPEIVKVDVEGAEPSVLRGAAELLRRRHALLFLELHFGAAARGTALQASIELQRAGWSWQLLAAERATGHYACAPAR